jgi:TatA/E family protein of Tat protein translocase
MVFHAPAIIDGIGGPEMVLIFLLVLLLFGGKKLPDFARGLGKSVREFKRAAAGVEDEIKRAIDAAPSSEPSPSKPIKPAPRIEAPKPVETPADTTDEYPIEDQNEGYDTKPADKPTETPPEKPKDFLS